MITLSCCIPGGSLMPEGITEVPKSPAGEIVNKCRYLLSTGYDCTECGGGMLAELGESDIEYLFSENNKSSLKLIAVNSLFPGSWKLSDPKSDKTEYLDRAEKIFEIMENLGAKYAVFGSGAARTLSTDCGREESYNALVDFILALADKAEGYGVMLLIEPLRRKETDVFVSVEESGDAVRKINHCNVKLLIDSFHMAEEKSDVLCIRNYMDLTMHCHISESPRRTIPGASDIGDLEYNKKFARELINAGYNGCVSVECGFSDFKSEAVTALKYLKGIFDDGNCI